MINDSLIYASVANLPLAERIEALAAVGQFISMQREVVKAQLSGVRVAPIHRLSIPDQFRLEANRRNNFSSPAFMAAAESLELCIATASLTP